MTLKLKDPLFSERQARILKTSCVSTPQAKPSQGSDQNIIRGEAQRRYQESFKACQEWLGKGFPAVFDFKNPKPLKIGIIQDIIAVVPDGVSRIKVRKAIKHYAGRRAYLKAVLKGGGRYDLNGERVQDIKDTEKEHALERLREKEKKRQMGRRENGQCVTEALRLDQSASGTVSKDTPPE